MTTLVWPLWTTCKPRSSLCNILYAFMLKLDGCRLQLIPEEICAGTDPRIGDGAICHSILQFQQDRDVIAPYTTDLSYIGKSCLGVYWDALRVLCDFRNAVTATRPCEASLLACGARSRKSNLLTMSNAFNFRLLRRCAETDRAVFKY
jgi:hypothetical protein